MKHPPVSGLPFFSAFDSDPFLGIIMARDGSLAQLAEQLTLNQWVQGSSPW